MTNATEIYVLDIDQLETLLEEEGLEHPDSDRLLHYIWLVTDGMYYKTEQDYRDNLVTWVSDEREHAFGHHDSEADFARYWWEGFASVNHPNFPTWLHIDWQKTWDSELRHDFYYEDSTGYVWSDIY